MAPGWPRVAPHRRWTTAIVFVLEVAIIDAQAWRGTTSHFNVATPLDAALFSVMGAAILIQTLVSVAVAVALWRQQFADRALGWALRLGMTLTIAGAMTGPLMTRPTAEQLADARAGGRCRSSGAHTVGGPDGGPGVPVTGWSREHGDLRVPHFVGLHAIQALALVALGLRRWRGPRRCASRAVCSACRRGKLCDAVRAPARGKRCAAERRRAGCHGPGRDRHLGGRNRARGSAGSATARAVTPARRNGRVA